MKKGARQERLLVEVRRVKHGATISSVPLSLALFGRMDTVFARTTPSRRQLFFQPLRPGNAVHCEEDSATSTIL